MTGPEFRNTSLPSADKAEPAKLPNTRIASQTVDIVLNVIHRNINGRNEYLLIQESPMKRDGGQWYLPAGRVDVGESFEKGLARETFEEAGVQAKPLGLITLERQISNGWNKQRLIFSSEQIGNDAPKSFVDEHSAKAAWFTYADVKKLPLRGTDVLRYIEHIENNKPIVPLSFLKEWIVPNGR